MNEALYNQTADKFKQHYGTDHTATAYAPGRVEVLGNHTDYNEGLVLSAAINMGIFCLAAPSPDNTCRIVAGDLMQEASFELTDLTPDPDNMWANYIKGVFVKLREREQSKITTAFNLLFFSNVPLGAGLSSSAALEISSGLCFSSLYDVSVPKLDMALIGQASEHEYAGVMCGVMDQISSIFGKENHLIKSDFRTLEVENAIEAYQRIIDLKNTFKLVWDNELGKAYLYTKNYDKSIEMLENSKVFSYDQGLFLAFAYLKKNNQKKFKEQFHKWISEDLEKSFERHYYMRHINLLFSEKEAKLIIDLWDKYHDKYFEMDKYKFYCVLYKQHYLKTYMTDDLLDDDDFEIPQKLNRSKFEYLSSVYLHLNKKTMIGDANDDDYEKYFELRDLLFADVIYG